MNNDQYLSAVAASIAMIFGSKRRQTISKRGERPQKAKFVHMPLADRLQLAFSAFPNHFGNYLGKRDPKPEPVVMTAAQRLEWLQQAHAIRARDYRWKRASVA